MWSGIIIFQGADIELTYNWCIASGLEFIVIKFSDNNYNENLNICILVIECINCFFNIANLHKRNYKCINDFKTWLINYPCLIIICKVKCSLYNEHHNIHSYVNFRSNILIKIAILNILYWYVIVEYFNHY